MLYWDQQARGIPPRARPKESHTAIYPSRFPAELTGHPRLKLRLKDGSRISITLKEYERGGDLVGRCKGQQVRIPISRVATLMRNLNPVPREVRGLAVSHLSSFALRSILLYLRDSDVLDDVADSEKGDRAMLCALIEVECEERGVTELDAFLEACVSEAKDLAIQDRLCFETALGLSKG
jgi:hypothetical protein